MIGLKRGVVKLVRHNPNWKRSYSREVSRITKTIGKDALEIHHVGSTSIPGIMAKPIIDIALIVPSFKQRKNYIRKIEAIGYTLKKDDAKKNRLFFTKGPEERRTHYLHVGAVGMGYAEDMILFSNYLREHKSIAQDYEKLKKQLAKTFTNTRELYTRKKEKFIKKILTKAKQGNLL